MTSEVQADCNRRLQKNTVAIQRLDDRGSRIPTPGVQPIRDQTHRMAANQTEKPPDPDHDPSGLDQATDLAGIHPVSHYLQHTLGVSRCLPAEDAESGSNVFQRRSVCAPCAELLDTLCEAV